MLGGMGTEPYDEFVVLRGVTWADYERLLEIRGDDRSPRMSYLDGSLELMTPSFDHDDWSRRILLLVAAYCERYDIPFHTAGCWTIKDGKKQQGGAEADECFIFGPRRRKWPPERMDLAIEVVKTSGAINKLEIWAKLSVREVWVWKKGRIQVYRLRGKAHHPARRSGYLPDLDLALLCKYVDLFDEYPSNNDVLRAWRRAVRRADRERSTRKRARGGRAARPQ